LQACNSGVAPSFADLPTSLRRGLLLATANYRFAALQRSRPVLTVPGGTVMIQNLP
jgi:hypothetical protein